LEEATIYPSKPLGRRGSADQKVIRKGGAVEITRSGGPHQSAVAFRY
jgi:hypothetical protein